MPLQVKAKDEDREIAEMLRACAGPPGQKVALVLGLLGAFAAGGVVFLAVARLGFLRGWTWALLGIAVLALFAGLWRAKKRSED